MKVCEFLLSGDKAFRKLHKLHYDGDTQDAHGTRDSMWGTSS
jgi:hypothetical protein